jgi:dipeptidyl aminopeptidase/acylaminoacyl peptidase
MAEPTVAPYGSWVSPITTELITQRGMSLGQVALDGAEIYWIEQRPSEGGRNVVVRRTKEGAIADVTPATFNARTRVHEYGGGAFAVADDVIYFSNYVDQRLYRQDPGLAPRPLTPEGDVRYANGVVDRRRNRLVCVREDHRDANHEAVSTLVSVDLAHGGEGDVLAGGNNFYSSPDLSPDDARLAWLTWNHPNMPWDGTELWVGHLNPDGTLSHAEHVAGGVAESIFQPQWSPDGTLYFVSDRNGWWNLYRWREGKVEPFFEVTSELGVAEWNLGLSTYGFADDGRLICTYSDKGLRRLVAIDPATRAVEHFGVPYSEVREIRVGAGRVVFIGGSPTEASSLNALNLTTHHLDVIRRSTEAAVDPGYLSRPQPIEFPTEHGLTAYAYFYPPANRDYVAPAGELPPLLVRSHGGPTSSTSTTLNYEIQYWTSRGFAFVDVNYGGSTGYGRAYRQRLNGQWGIVDVDDCVNAALYLVHRGLADPERLAIRGTSAGGFTTLNALTFRDVFKAGASYWGISDLEAMAKDTHKFESRYLDSMIGPYPERQDLYYERSSIHFVDRLSCPIIFVQGLEDKIVPPNQAGMMVDALRAKHLPVAYLTFEGEQHGLRRATSIKRALEAELYFYSRIFDFDLPEQVEPVEVENL